jgi:hypothetical protein
MIIDEQFPSDGVFCVFVFFSVVLLATWATQMRKYTNAQIAVPASLIC